MACKAFAVAVLLGLNIGVDGCFDSYTIAPNGLAYFLKGSKVVAADAEGNVNTEGSSTLPVCCAAVNEHMKTIEAIGSTHDGLYTVWFTGGYYILSQITERGHELVDGGKLTEKAPVAVSAGMTQPDAFAIDMHGNSIMIQGQNLAVLSPMWAEVLWKGTLSECCPALVSNGFTSIDGVSIVPGTDVVVWISGDKYIITQTDGAGIMKVVSGPGPLPSGLLSAAGCSASTAAGNVDMTSGVKTALAAGKSTAKDAAGDFSNLATASASGAAAAATPAQTGTSTKKGSTSGSGVPHGLVVVSLMVLAAAAKML